MRSISISRKKGRIHLTPEKQHKHKLGDRQYYTVIVLPTSILACRLEDNVPNSRNELGPRQSGQIHFFIHSHWSRLSRPKPISKWYPLVWVVQRRARFCCGKGCFLTLAIVKLIFFTSILKYWNMKSVILHTRGK